MVINMIERKMTPPQKKINLLHLGHSTILKRLMMKLLRFGLKY